MFIKSISLCNFKIYKGENRIDFEEDPNRNIYLLAGYNGYGKTTFLTSLVWCLFGRYMQDVDEFFRKKIQEAGGYPGYLDACLNRSARIHNQNEYSVTITISNLQIPGITAQEVDIKRSFSIGDKQDLLEIRIDGQLNELVEDVGYDIFVQDFILPKEIAKFFFFDAEKITAIAEVQSVEQRKQLGSAYSEVLGIKKYVDLRSNLLDLRLKYKRESASPQEIKQLEAEEAVASKLAHGIKQRNQLINEYSKELDEKAKRSDELQEKLVREGNSISLEQLASLKNEKARLSDRGKEYKERLEGMLDFAPFAIAGRLFFSVEHQLKAEQQVKHQKGLTMSEVDLLAQSLKKMIAGLAEPIEKGSLEAQLDEVFARYTVSNPLTLTHEGLPILHEFDEVTYRSFIAIADNLNSAYKDQFKHLNRDIKRNRYDINEVNKKLSRAESKEGDLLIQKYRQEKGKLDSESLSIRDHIFTLAQEVGSMTNELNSRKKVIQEISKKLSVKEDIIEKDITAERLIKELDQFIVKIQQEKKITLESSICSGLNALMHKKEFVKRVSVQVDGEIIDIELYNERDERISKEDLSMGEKQLYATAILQALVEESNIEFPVFIDSPMQKLDVAHARNIITDFYPKVSKQVVILPLLNKEMTVDEFALIKPNVKGCYVIKNHSEDASTFVHVSNEDLFTVDAALEDNRNEIYV